MILTAFNGYDFDANGYWCSVADSGKGQWTIVPSIVPRRDAFGEIAGGTISERVIPVTFGYSGSLTFEQAFLQLLGKLDPTNTTPRLLEGQLNASTAVECDAIITIPNGLAIDDEVSTIQVTFLAVSPFWREQSDTTTSPATITIDGNNWDGVPAIGIQNAGQALAYPQLDIEWTTQYNGSGDATWGWKYRKRITVENDTSRDWHRQIVFANLGDTAALVTGSKAQSDGDDYRLFLHGGAVPIHMLNWNTKMSHMAFVVERLAAGESQEYEFVYGNTGASEVLASKYLDLYQNQYTSANYVAIDLGDYSGTATAGAAGTLTDGGASWPTNRWRGGFIKIVAGTGATDDQIRRIASNTGTVITVDRNWRTTPDNTSVYVIWMSGIAQCGWDASAATASTITDSSQSWRTNEWKGATVYITSGTGSGQTATVDSNTATVLTLTASLGTPPDATSNGYIDKRGHHLYQVNQTNVTPGSGSMSTKNWGLWRISHANKKPSVVRYADQVPGAWTPFLRLENQDDYTNEPYTLEGSYYWGTPRCRRRRRQDGRYKSEGQADSVQLYDPRGFIGWYFDYRVKNSGGIGMVYFAGQGPGGEDLTNEVEYTTTQSTLTAISAQYLDFSSDPHIRLAMGVLPFDGETEISRNTKASNEVELRTYQRFELHLDPRNWSVTVGSEENIYDLQMTLTQYPGVISDAPSITRSAVIGYSSDNPRYLFLEADETLRIITDPASTDYPLAIYDGSTFVRACPWAARFEETIYPDGSGEGVTSASRQWWPLEPSTNMVTNPTFASDFTPWAEDDDHGTTAWSRDAGVYHDAAGSGKAVVTVNGRSLGDLISNAISDEFVVLPGNSYALSGWVRTTHADIYPILGVKWFSDTAGTTEISESGGDYPGTPIGTGAWYPSVTSNPYTAPATAVTARITLNVISLDGASTGTAYFDNITFGTHVFEAVIGQVVPGSGVVTFAPSWREGYYG